MKFFHQDLGHRLGGEIVEISLSGTEANVLLLDDSSFQNYRSGRRYTYRGGHTKRSPVRLAIPHSGHWHVAVDMGGYGGSFRASVRMLPGALPPIQETSLASVPSLVRRAESEAYLSEDDTSSMTFDVFISHASEDKDVVVRPLAKALRESGLSVWYDEFELRLGDSIRRKIDMGLARSQFGIVVLSQPFFAKGWANYELDGLVTRANGGEQVLLPIWHNVSRQEVIKYSPSLADKVARSTSTHTVEEIAAEIVNLILEG